jgi:hypothetical protein
MTASAQVGLRLSRITHPPLDALAVNSGFGPRRRPVAGASTNHRGVDYAAQVGTNVYAAGDGVVITSRCARANPTCGPRANGEITAGYIVEVDHGNGETTRYLHLTNPALVQPGDRVTAGQVIAQSGNTGGVGPHLHFEVRKNGVAVDPQRFFGGPLTATMAMAIDNHVQAGSQLEIPLTRGEITPETLEQYIGVVDLSGLSLGVHKLQFVLVQPRRRLAVLAEVPLIVAQGVLTGTEISIDAVTTPISEAGAFDRKNNRKEFTFTLSAAENGTIEGAGHVTYSLGYESFRPNSGCPDTTSFASVEWDVSLSGFYSRLEDGSISVTFFSTPSAGPRYLFTQNSPGCPEKTFTQELSGESSPSLSATLVDGYYSFRTDVPLSTGQTGEYSHTLSMYWLE